MGNSVLFVLNGFFKDTDSVSWIFRWVIYISPHRYAWQGLSYLAFEGDVYDDFAECEASQATGNVCFGSNGDEYLGFLNGTNSDISVLKCCLVLLIMAVFLR